MPRINPVNPSLYSASWGGDGALLSLGAGTAAPHVVLGPTASGDWWLDANQIVTHAHLADSRALIALDVRSWTRRTVLEDPDPPTWFSAGGGRIAVWSVTRGPLLDGEPVQVVPVGFGPDGTFAWRDWGSNTGITLTPNGRRPGSSFDLRITDAPYISPQIFEFGRAVWQDGSAVRQVGLTDWPVQTRTLPGDFGWTRAVRINGHWFLAYQSFARQSVVLHPADDASAGHEWAAPLAYRLDVSDVGGAAFLVWSVVDRDWPQDIVAKTVEQPHIATVTFDLPPLPPPPPSPPDPDPPPNGEPSVPKMLPADVHATFVAVVEKYPHTGDDTARREAMKKAVQTIRARHGERYVWKTEHSNLSSPSKDGMGYVADGQQIVHGKLTPMYIWDMIDGTTRQPQPAHESETMRTAYVIAVEPKDWLETDPPPPPPPPPPGDDDIARLEQAILSVKGTADAARNSAEANRVFAENLYNSMRAKFEEYDREIKALKEKPPHDVDLSGFVAEGQVELPVGASWPLRARGKVRLIVVQE